MYRSFSDQFDTDDYDQTEREYCTDSRGCEKGHYSSTKAAQIALDLSAVKARSASRVAPIRYYQCSDPSKACFLEFHLTSKL